MGVLADLGVPHPGWCAARHDPGTVHTSRTHTVDTSAGPIGVQVTLDDADEQPTVHLTLPDTGGKPVTLSASESVRLAATIGYLTCPESLPPLAERLAWAAASTR